MGIGEELKKMGYQFEYESGDSEDRTEVWTNTITASNAQRRGTL